MPISLPTTPIPAKTVSPTVLTLYGAPKIGKTSIITALDSYLLLELEPGGADFLDACKLQVDNLLLFNGIADEIKRQRDKTNTDPYKFIIVDTVDELEVWCEKDARNDYMKTPQGKSFSGDSILELPQGGGYYWLRNSFYKWFHHIRRMAPFTIFIGHVRDKLLTNEGKEVSSKDLDLTGKVRNILCSYSDAIGHMYRNVEGKLIISFETKDTVQCGSRAKHLAGKKFTFSQPATRDDWKQIYPDVIV